MKLAQCALAVAIAAAASVFPQDSNARNDHKKKPQPSHPIACAQLALVYDAPDIAIISCKKID